MATNFVKKMANSSLSSLWHSETKWDNAVYMHDLIVPLMPLYHVKIKNFGEDRSSSFGEEQANRWKLRYVFMSWFCIFCQISPNVLDQFSRSFHHMRALWVQIRHLYFIFRLGKGHCHGNQIMLGETRN